MERMNIWKQHSQEASKKKWEALWAMEDLHRGILGFGRKMRKQINQKVFFF